MSGSTNSSPNGVFFRPLEPLSASYASRQSGKPSPDPTPLLDFEMKFLASFRSINNSTFSQPDSREFSCFSAPEIYGCEHVSSVISGSFSSFSSACGGDSSSFFFMIIMQFESSELHEEIDYRSHLLPLSESSESSEHEPPQLCVFYCILLEFLSLSFARVVLTNDSPKPFSAPAPGTRFLCKTISDYCLCTNCLK